MLWARSSTASAARISRITGRGGAENTAAGFAAGATDYLTKPFDPWVLRAKVSVFVDLFKKTEEVKRQAEQLRDRERRAEARPDDECVVLVVEDPRQ